MLPFSLPLLGSGITSPAHPKRLLLRLLSLLRHPFDVMYILPVTDITWTPFAKPVQPFEVPDGTPPPRARSLRPDILDVKECLVTHPAIKPEIMRRLSEHRFEGVTLSFPTLPDPKHVLFPILHRREAIYQNSTRKIINRNRRFFFQTKFKPGLIFIKPRKRQNVIFRVYSQI